MDGAFAPAHGNFHAVYQPNAQGLRFLPCFGQAAGVVVVGEREQGATIGVRQFHYFAWRQGAV